MTFLLHLVNVAGYIIGGLLLLYVAVRVASAAWFRSHAEHLKALQQILRRKGTNGDNHAS